MVFEGMPSMLTKGEFSSEHGNSLLSMPEYTILNFMESQHERTPWRGFNLSLHFPALKTRPWKAQTCSSDLQCRDSTPYDAGLRSPAKNFPCGFFTEKVQCKLQAQPSHPSSFLELMSAWNSEFFPREDHRGQQNLEGGTEQFCTGQNP